MCTAGGSGDGKPRARRYYGGIEPFFGSARATATAAAFFGVAIIPRYHFCDYSPPHAVTSELLVGIPVAQDKGGKATKLLQGCSIFCFIIASVLVNLYQRRDATAGAVYESTQGGCAVGGTDAHERKGG